MTEPEYTMATVAFEMGFKAAERGDNLEKALHDFRATLLTLLTNKFPDIALNKINNQDKDPS